MDWNVVIILLIIAVLAYFFISGKLFRPMGRGRPLEINDPPIEIPPAEIKKSKVELTVDDAFSKREGITFVTEKISATPMMQPGLTEEHRVLTLGDEEHPWKVSGLFEIHVFFSLHNWSEEIMNIYDIHSRLYHVSAGYTPLMLGYVSRYRVDLSADNSILHANTIFQVEHGSAVYFELVFETGFYDHTGTTLAVFGLEVDFELCGPEGVSKWRIPSDNIYTVQHWGPPYESGSTIHVRNMDSKYISAGYQREKRKFLLMPDTAAAQTSDFAVIFECLGKILAQHRAEGVHRLN